MDRQLVRVSFQVSEAVPTAWTLRMYALHTTKGSTRDRPPSISAPPAARATSR
jgi:hypothetical protein